MNILAKVVRGIGRIVWSAIRLVLIGGSALSIIVGGVAFANYAATQGSGTNFGSIVVSMVHYMQMLVCDPTTPANCASIGTYGTAPGAVNALNVNAYVTDTTTALPNNADGVAVQTGAANSPVNDYNYVFNGTSWDRARSGSQTGAVLVSLSANAANGWTPKWFVAANTDNATNLKASAGTVHAVQVFGIGSTPAYLKFYNKATSPTCGSDTIVKQVMIPAASTAANGAGAIAITLDTAFSTGISYCVVTGIGATDDTAPAAATFVVNIDWL